MQKKGHVYLSKALYPNSLVLSGERKRKDYITETVIFSKTVCCEVRKGGQGIVRNGRIEIENASKAVDKASFHSVNGMWRTHVPHFIALH